MVKLIAMIGYIPISLQAYDIRTLTHFICFATPQKKRGDLVQNHFFTVVCEKDAVSIWTTPKLKGRIWTRLFNFRAQSSWSDRDLDKTWNNSWETRWERISTCMYTWMYYFSPVQRWTGCQSRDFFAVSVGWFNSAGNLIVNAQNTHNIALLVRKWQ